jgi:peptide/nickel transport system permease protein
MGAAMSESRPVALSMLPAFVPALFRSKPGLAGAVILTIFVLAALLAPILGLPDPVKGDLLARLKPPTISLSGFGAHPLGTDQLGRDILSRIIYGGRVTLMIAALSVLTGGVFGVVIGLISGFFGGWVDRVLMRIVDMQLSVPLTILALLIIASLGPELHNLVAVLALTSWVQYARVVRGQVLAVRSREYIQSARAIAAHPLRIIFHHVLPNVMTPAIVVLTLELARIILLEAGLSFLGLGIQPPAAAWGRMLAEGRTFMSTAWWLSVFPGLAIMLTVLSVNLLGDWLRDYFDPHLEG